jgi:hypothetical protein
MGETHASRHHSHGHATPCYFDGRALPKRLGVNGLGDSLGCLGFFFSLRLSLFPTVSFLSVVVTALRKEHATESSVVRF